MTLRKLISNLYLYLKSHQLIVLVGIYGATRLINLTLLPVFSDEALYMDWGWQALHIAGKLWHPLSDAKQPFLMWFFGLGQMLFPNPLFGARLVSVLAGLLSFLGLWKIGNDFFNRRIAILILISYLISPIFLFFDRQALMESAITASAVWSLYFLLKLLDSQKIKYAGFLGLSLGLGLFVKNSALIFFVTALLIIFIHILGNKKQYYFLSLSLITITITFILVNLPLFFQQKYWSTLSTNSRWTFTLSELLRFPMGQWTQNLLGNTQIIFLFLTPLVFIFSLLGIRSTLKAKSYQLKAILLWFLISYLLYLISLKFMNFMSFRYIVPFLPPALIFAAYYLSRKSKWLICISLLLPALFSFVLVVSPISFFKIDAKINRFSYTDGYLTGFDTGYQVNAIVKYFKSASVGKNIVVTTAVHTFNPESGVWDYLRKDENITLAYLDGRLLGNTGEITCLTNDRPTYFLAKLNDTVGLDKFLEKVTVITNPYNTDYSTVYKLKDPCTGPSAKLTLDYSY